MHHPLIRLCHHIGTAFLQPLWLALTGPSPVPPPCRTAPDTTDWRTPAYLRRRVSGDALACPWPLRQR